MVVAGFSHRPGVHCGSTALADVLRLRGVDVSEAMAFGLGAGLGFYYLASPALSPTHLFQGRSAHLERSACEVLGAPFREGEEDDGARAWEAVRAAVDRGAAPILSTDLAELPYWRTRTRFGGHRVVLAGYDLARGVAIVADGDRPGLDEVPLDALEHARASIAPPFGIPGRPWLEVDAPPRPRPLAEAIREALRRQARDMLLEPEGAAGISALERFAAELPGWPARAADEADRAWCFRYAYQVVERRGTGGGLFRALYAAFLREAEALVPGLARLGLSARMGALAEGWASLARAFREIAQVPGGGVPPAVAAAAAALARDERRFHEDLAARVP
ncbi:MAG TPA: BtrH N-terminal domain-containing protein [Anaeromyxobacter sp.]|nr:BtrH N-terminal domain-containing protein [Anaeromyxobacter sp.]